MKNNTNKTISKLLCVALLASMVAEAPLMAAATNTNQIAVNVNGQTVNVTPGQWVTVNNGGTTASYNVRYLNGKAVALDVKQYTSLVLGETAGATAASNVAQAAQAAQAPAQTAQVAQSTAQTAQAADVAATSGAKTTAKSGSWIKNELAEYGSNIKNSFTSGKESGQAFGTKTVDTVKSGASTVGEKVSSAGSKVGGFFKSIGSKVGGALKTAKDKVTGLFKKNNTNVASEKGSSSAEASQSGETSSQNAEQNSQTSQSSEQASQNAEQASQNAEQNSQTSQSSEQTTQATEQAAAETSTVSEQTAQASEQASNAKGEATEKKGFFSKMKDKAATGLKSGYEAGKAMTKQGVQNVKDSLKSGFSAKNILVTAGITVATDLATQIIRGQDVSLKSALKTVCCAEFAGSVVGSVTGAAAGSFFTPFLSAIPVVGGALSALAPTFGSVIGSSVGAYLAGDLKNGRFSIKNAFKSIDWAGVVGQSIGSTAGAALGSCLGPVGTIIGGIVGGYAGNWVAQKLKTWFGGKDSYGSIGMPVGTSTMGSVVAGEVSIGSVAGNVSSEIPVAMSSEVPTDEIAVSSSVETMGTYSSEVAMAEAKYQELYKLYQEMLSQGRQEDALKVAVEMNKAKSDYESLKAKSY